MNIIKYNEFCDSKSLKKTISDFMTKLINFDEVYQKITFDLLMYEISYKININELENNSNTKLGYWEKVWGPCEEIFLTKKNLGSYYISFFKYYNSKDYKIKVISVYDLVKSKYNNNVIEWLNNNEQELKNNKNKCSIM